MKYIQYIPIIAMMLITSLFTFLYGKRARLEYNDEGRFLAIEEGVVYHKQATEVYGVLAILGFIFTVIIIINVLKKHLSKKVPF